MSDYKVNFREMKSRVGIDDIAYALGYRLDRKAGVGRYIELVLGEGGNKRDTLIVSHPNDKAAQTFFRRDGSKGDVVTLIRENLSSFTVSGKDEWQKIAKVMARFANMPEPEYREYVKSAGKSPGVFDASRYEVKPVDTGKIPGLFFRRGLSKATVTALSPFISLIRDRNNGKFEGYNIGFPYTDGKGNEVRGYEIRGHGGYKSKAAGTDSSSSAWVAVPSDKIKLRITVVTALAVFLLKGTYTFAQQTDPTLTGAVFAQTSTLKNIYDKRQKAHEKIIAAETAVTVALDRVHSVENKMLEYLSNAQGAMQNLYQIKRAGELVATEIPQNCSLLLKSVGSNLKGTAIAAIVSDELADAATQMAALYPFMKQLVTSGSYDTGGSDGGKEKHKVNLLSSSERYYIANEVLTRLEAVNTDLFILAWQVRTLSWNDLWFSLDPEGWANVMSGKNIIGGIVADWNRGFSFN